MLPNRRAILVKNKSSGEDPTVDLVLADSNSPEALLYKKTIDLLTSRIKKQYLEASLLATSDTKQISDLLEMDESLIKAYAFYHYDLTDFDKLSKLELLDVEDSQEAMMKIWALSQGLTFLRWRLGKSVTINPIDGLKDLFTTCVYKSKEALFTSNASESSKEATKWTKLSMDLARLLKMWVLDGNAAKRDIELALEEFQTNFKGLEDIEATENLLPEELEALSEEVDAGTLETPQFGSLEDLLKS